MCLHVCVWDQNGGCSVGGRRFGKEFTNMYLMPFMSQALCQVLLLPLAPLHKNLGVRYCFSGFPGEATQVLEMLSDLLKDAQLTCG